MKARINAAFGESRYTDDPEILDGYSKDHSFVPSRKPLGVVRPRNTEEIVKIVGLANDLKIPLVPVSSGPPRFHGDTVPTIPGIIVDLSTIKEVLRVDRKNRIAIVDAGVTFEQLRAACAAEGLEPYTPLLPRKTKSVLASALEREPITIAKDHWDIIDPLVAGEMVFGTGDVFRSGEASVGTRDDVVTGKLIPVTDYGPGHVHFLKLMQASQGSFGILSWASVRCRIRPVVEKGYFVPSKTLDTLVPFCYKLFRHRLGDHFFILNSASLASILGEGSAHIKKIQSELPPWTLFFSLGGYSRYPQERIAYKENHIRSIAQDCGLAIVSDVADESAHDFLLRLGTSEENDRRLKYKSSCQDLPLMATLDKAPDIVDTFLKTAGVHGYPSGDTSIYLQPVQRGRGCHLEFNIPYDAENKAEALLARNFYEEASWKLDTIGALFSRPYGSLSEIVYRREAETTACLRKVKQIVDPNNILNPGKLCF